MVGHQILDQMVVTCEFGSRGEGGHYQVTTLGKLFTPTFLCYQEVKLVPTEAEE